MDHSIGSQNTEETGALGCGSQTQGAGVRRHDLDALRAIAMLLGICLHAMAAYSGLVWVFMDSHQNPAFQQVTSFIHGFRMQLFFLVSGFFTAMVSTRYGIWGMLRNRAARILVPFLICLFTLIPLVKVVSFLAVTANASHPQNPFFLAIRDGDIKTIEKCLEQNGSALLEERESRLKMTPLIWAVLCESEELVGYFLDRGADPMAVSRSGENPLTYAAMLGRLDLLKMIVAKGGDPFQTTKWGRSPWKAANQIPAETSTILWLARGKGLDTGADQSRGNRDVINYLNQLYKKKDLIPEAPTVAGPPEASHAMATLPGWMQGYFAWLASGEYVIKIGGARIDLLQENLFDHLWFLWFLWWLCLVHAGLGWTIHLSGLVMTRPKAGLYSGLLVAVASTLCFQAFMNLDYYPRTLNFVVGPDLSGGFIPKPHVFLYYSVFFFFGSWYFRLGDSGCRLGGSWPFALGLAALVLFPLLVEANVNGFQNIVLQTLFTWLMVVGSIGLAHRVFRGESGWFRYLADSSYWLYLIHVPLIIGCQWFLYYWPLPALVKFLIILIIIIPMMLVSYKLFVRNTIIGRILNGKNPSRIPEKHR